PTSSAPDERTPASDEEWDGDERIDGDLAKELRHGAPHICRSHPATDAERARRGRFTPLLVITFRLNSTAWQKIDEAGIDPRARGERGRDDVFELRALFREAVLQAGIRRKLVLRG